MSSTYSTDLRLELIGNGEQAGTWGNTTNNNLGTLIEQAIAGVGTVSLTGLTSYTLTALNGASDQARNATLQFTGSLTANCTVIAPAVQKVYIVSNQTTGGYSVNLQTPSGNAYPISSGVTNLIYCDGTNFYSGTPSAASNSGRIRQIVGGYKSFYFATSSTSPTPVTGVSLNITPTSNTSTILVLWSSIMAAPNGGGGIMSGNAEMSMFRNGVNLTGSLSTPMNDLLSDNSDLYANSALSIVDTPNTTSAVTYQPYAWCDTGLGSVLYGGGNFILMEIL
jgi:hypothetical protein